MTKTPAKKLETNRRYAKKTYSVIRVRKELHALIINLAAAHNCSQSEIIKKGLEIIENKS